MHLSKLSKDFQDLIRTYINKFDIVISRINSNRSISKTSNYIFWITSVFYFSVLLLNPNNKIIAILFAFLFVVYFFVLRNARLSLILCFLASFIIPSGKTYDIELLSEKVFTNFGNQDNFRIFFTINPNLIIGFLMLLIIFRDMFLGVKRRNNFQKRDILLFFYFFGILFTNTFFSKRPDVSFLTNVTLAGVLAGFTFIKMYTKGLPKLLTFATSLFASQVIFECFIAILQFFLASPLGRTVEAPFIYQVFGIAPDELVGRFRPVGTMVHTTEFAAWLLFTTLIIFAYNYKKANILFFLINILSFIVLVLTLSRGAWFSLFIGIVFCLYFFEKVLKLKKPEIFNHIGVGYILLLVGLLIFFIFPRVEKSLYLGNGGLLFRVNQIKGSLSILNNNYLFGVGSSMSLPEIVTTKPASYLRKIPTPLHNWYIISIIEHGVINTGFLVLYIVLFLRSKLNKLLTDKKPTVNNMFGIGFAAGTIGLLIIASFQPFVLQNIIILTSGILSANSGES